jgi:Ca2+:H+ antiporter
VEWAALGCPLLALVVLGVTWGDHVSGVLFVVVLALLGAAVLSAVFHAEVVAHRVGEPFGSLLLAVAVTVIEVALIVTLMASSSSATASLARDTVFSALMVTINGIMGLALLIVALRSRVALFSAEGSGSALATVAALATLSLVLPTFTTSSPGPTFSGHQLAFAAIASLALYALFVFVLTIRHREDFTGDARLEDAEDAEQPSSGQARTSVAILMVALVGVVGLAKVASPTIETGVASIGLPYSFVGVIIAFVVLLPEGITAVRAARRNQVQRSVNLALGSAMASIGLTIPTIAVVSIWHHETLVLGLAPVQLVLLALTVAVGILTVTPGRSTLMQGGLHLSILAAYVFLSISP